MLTNLHLFATGQALRATSGNTDKLDGTDVGEVELTTNKPVIFENFNNVPGLGRIVLVENEEIVAAGIISKGVI